MIRGFDTSHSAMKYLQKNQDTVANNIANISTTGFKEQITTAKSKEAMNIKNRKTGKEVGFINPGIEFGSLHEISSQGTLVDTGIQTDFAISGEGYFTVEMKDGNYAYTRNGSFSFDANGRLLTDSGYPIIAKNTVTGENSYIDVKDSNILVNSDGSISNTEGLKINLVQFEDSQLLTRVGENLYTAVGIQTVPNTTSTIKQFSIESSNVDMASQMIKMLEVSRGYAANQRALKNTDEILQKTVNQLGSLK